MQYQNENFSGSCDLRCRCHNTYMVEPHLHAYSELLYCVEGQGEVFVNGKKLVLCRKQMVWIPPNYIHQYAFPEGKTICAVFSMDLVPLFFRAAEGRALQVEPVDVGELEPVVLALPDLDRSRYVTISGCLNLICGRVLDQSSFSREENTDGILYQKVISYISSHYTEDLSLKQLAKHFGYNEKYMSGCLHQLTGIHFRRLLAMYRVEQAKVLLQTHKDVSISDIALSCGFSAINTFHRAFRESTGMVPSEYRKLYRK